MATRQEAPSPNQQVRLKRRLQCASDTGLNSPARTPLRDCNAALYFGFKTVIGATLDLLQDANRFLSSLSSGSLDSLSGPDPIILLSYARHPVS